jgi:GNAT superfamily N-acetyltransferase
VRPLREADLDAADRIMRLAFGTFRGLPDPSATFGDAQPARTRFRAAPECAWAAEDEGTVVGSVFAARWGAFGFFGPLTVHPDRWDRGVGSLLLEPVLQAFERWELRQAGLFTFPGSPRHLGLYQKHGFWPRFLTAVMAKPVAAGVQAEYTLFSQEASSHRADVLERCRELAGAVFDGLDLEREILAAHAQGIGDTILVHGEDGLAGMAVCHLGGGSEAGSGVCYVKFGVARPGSGAPERFERLLHACESFAAESRLPKLVAGVNTGRLGAYRRMLGGGFQAELIGVSMCLRPDVSFFDTPDDYVMDDLR